MIIFNRLCCSLSFQRECAFPIVTFYFLFRVWIISCRLTAPCVFSQYAGLCKHNRRIAHFYQMDFVVSRCFFYDIMKHDDACTCHHAIV